MEPLRAHLRDQTQSGTDGTAGCLKVFLHDVVSKHGVPDELIPDRDARFTSSLWTELMKSLNVKMCLSSAYHPQSDGQTERMNRVLEDNLRHYVAPNWTGMNIYLGQNLP